MVEVKLVFATLAEAAQFLSGQGGAEVADAEAVPSARALAERHNVDLTKIQGTGQRGRILKLDVQRYIDSRAVPEPETEEPETEEPETEEPETEEPKAEEPKAEEPKAEEPKAEEPEVTKDELRAKFRELSGKSPNAVLDVLAQVKASRLSDITPDKYGEVLGLLESELRNHGGA